MCGEWELDKVLACPEGPAGVNADGSLQGQAPIERPTGSGEMAGAEKFAVARRGKVGGRNEDEQASRRRQGERW